MVVFTDSIDYADVVLGRATREWSRPRGVHAGALEHLVERLYGGRAIWESELRSDSLWQYLYLVVSASISNYDLLVNLSREARGLPNGVLCMAGSGERFHGFRGRPWSGPPGNIYLAAYLTPGQPVDHPATCFTVLAAVSVVDTIDATPGLTHAARVKWVNDILVDGAKVAGVLAYTESVGATVDAVALGIGLNVETTPAVDPTPFVPRVGSLAEFSVGRECTQRLVFSRLIRNLASNYDRLLSGAYGTLLERYRSRSLVMGRRVTLCAEGSDPEPRVLAEGRVERLSDDLELVLEGCETPFSRGRIVLGER